MTTASCDDKPYIVLDLETYSSADLAKTGVFKYVEAEDFEILLMSYGREGEQVQVWDFTADGVPPWLPGLLTDPGITKVAHNAQFERTCLHQALGVYSPPGQWRDTMHLAAQNGLPSTLEAAGAALQLDQQKLDTGKALIRYFCKPCAPTKVNGGRTRNLPGHAPDKWAQFIEYCRRDTEAEREIYKRLRRTRITDTEREIECLDARINERGVMIDLDMVAGAIRIDEAFKQAHTDELQRLTGLANPNSVAQLKTWLAGRGLVVDSLDKKALADLLDKATDPTTRRALTLRQMLGKSSTAKYAAMQAAACADSRVRGTLQYYGAGRTGRWAGRIIQPQNLPQNHLDQLAELREIVRARDLDGLELVYDNVPDVLSQLIRTAIVAKPGHTFLVADLHAIEAVCIAYLANEQWRLDVFAGDGKIYEASYAQAFGVPKDSVKKGSPERQKGKIMELACGYGGGVGALKAFGADKLGLSDAELQDLIDSWRAASPMITRMWRAVERAAKEALKKPGARRDVKRKEYDAFRALDNEWAMQSGGFSKLFNAEGIICSYRRDADALRCKLPSGRVLTYWGARLDEETGSIRFMAQNQTTRKWERAETWGGRLVENIVQAFARDILAEAILRLERAGLPVVFSVHDEVIVEAPIGGRWEDVADLMTRPVSWAPGLDKYLEADGFETPFYCK